MPPVTKSFQELSKKEANDYFSWFLSHIDERSLYLVDKVSVDLKTSRDLLDFSLDSTKIIWEWFLHVAEVTKTPQNVLANFEKSLEGKPRSFIEHMLKDYEKELSVFTEYVLRDIGMYIAKMFISSFQCLKWTIKYTPKSYVHVNVPLIAGFVDDNETYPKPFHPVLEPIDLARTPAIIYFLRNQKSTDLYSWCCKWVQWVPQQ